MSSSPLLSQLCLPLQKSPLILPKFAGQYPFYNNQGASFNSAPKVNAVLEMLARQSEAGQNTSHTGNSMLASSQTSSESSHTANGLSNIQYGMNTILIKDAPHSSRNEVEGGGIAEISELLTRTRRLELETALQGE